VIFVMAGDGLSHFITSHDGLKLHISAYGSRPAASVPVVCLPGLARTGADFDTLATALAGDCQRPRYVITMDYRGRGRSDYDRNPFNYNLAIELADVLAVLTALDIGPAVFVGTSRGGILAMLLASARPTAIAGVVLNDIGPVLDLRGLARIKSYVGNLPEPKSFRDGAEILRRLFAAQFPKLSPDDWLAFSKRTFKDQDGRLLATYDVRIAKTLADINLERPLQPLWVEFDALARVPDIEAIEVPDQGHAPLLVEPEIISQIGAFIANC
jgi:pimeloyl-ACP methyl ester carboxylesterase